jgi:hypothetical protein
MEMLLRGSQMISQARWKLNMVHQDANLPLMGSNMSKYIGYISMSKTYLRKLIKIVGYIVA